MLTSLSSFGLSAVLPEMSAMVGPCNKLRRPCAVRHSVKQSPELPSTFLPLPCVLGGLYNFDESYISLSTADFCAKW